MNHNKCFVKQHRNNNNCTKDKTKKKNQMCQAAIEILPTPKATIKLFKTMIKEKEQENSIKNSTA